MSFTSCPQEIIRLCSIHMCVPGIHYQELFPTWISGLRAEVQVFLHVLEGFCLLVFLIKLLGKGGGENICIPGNII